VDNNRVASSLHIDELVAVFDLQLQKDESIEELVKGCYPLLTTHHRTIYFVDPSVRDYINGSDRGILSLAPEGDYLWSKIPQRTSMLGTDLCEQEREF
jgi:hypothetical protein